MRDKPNFLLTQAVQAPSGLTGKCPPISDPHRRMFAPDLTGRFGCFPVPTAVLCARACF